MMQSGRRISVNYAQPDLDDLLRLFNGQSLNVGVRFGGNDGDRHQCHDRQADKFVEVSYKKGLHRLVSVDALEASPLLGELVL